MLEKITQIFADYKGTPDLVLTEDTSFTELQLDSLEMMELIMEIEDKFAVTITVNDPLKTVGDLVKLVENSLS